MGWANEVNLFMTKVHNFKTNESKEMVPVPCILFADNGIDSRIRFASDGHAGKSVYETAYEMLTMLKMPCSGVTSHPHFGAWTFV